MSALKPEMQRRLRGADRRAAVLAVARECFAERGYQGASMREIARRCEITAPVLYDHFPSKDQLHRELLEREGEELIAAVCGPFVSRTPEEFLRQSIDAFFSFLSSHRHTWRLLFAESSGAPEIASVQEQIFARATATLIELFALTPGWTLSRPTEQGLATEMLAQLTRSALSGLAGWWWRHQEISQDEVATTSMDLLWRGLGDLVSITPRREETGERQGNQQPRRPR